MHTPTFRRDLVLPLLAIVVAVLMLVPLLRGDAPDAHEPPAVMVTFG